MPTDHFERLGTLASAILAANDTIIETGQITNGPRGARYLVGRHRGVQYSLYAHPGDPEITLESPYRPSGVIRAEMTPDEFETYADQADITAQSSKQLRDEVVKHRVRILNKKAELEAAYEPVREAKSLSHPRVLPLSLDEHSDDPDGFVVREGLYPGEARFATSRYTEKVSRALDRRVELARALHQNLGLDELSDDPAEYEPDEPGSGLEDHAFA